MFVTHPLRMGREHIPRMVSSAGKTMSIQAAGAVWKEGEGCMDKKEAIQICRNKGLPITAHISNLASKNIRRDVYWTTPSIDRLSHDWWLILNDDIRCILYVFCTPTNTIKQNQVYLKNNKLMHIEIQYNDPSFEDTRSKICFKPWLRTTISY